MNIQTIHVDSCAATGIAIGRRGSYDTQQIVFDLSALIAEYGNGSAALLVLRPTDTTPYPATAIQSGTELTWTVSATDTAIPGAGECELFWYVDGGLAKSVIYPLIITEDIIGTDVPAPPDPYETWIEELTALGAETLENAQNAAQSATAAAASETAAAQSATNAEEAAEEAASSEEAATSAKNDAISAGNSAEASKNAAGEYAASAATSASSAATSATNAATAAETATAKATQAAASSAAAAASANSAADDASIATAQANAAKASASASSGLAATAIAKAGEAAASAVAAAMSATDSATSASASSGSASAASAKATEAAASASAASGKATEAANSATAAQTAQTGAEAAQQAAEEAAQSISESAAQIAQNTSDIADLDDDVSELKNATNDLTLNKAPVITDTASGAIASFPDGADNLPLKKLVAQIAPVQDLHGQDAPYPPGAGKNLFPYPIAKDETYSGVHFVSDGKGKITVTGTATGNTACRFNLLNSFTIPDGQQYQVCFLNTQASGAVVFKNGAADVDSWGLSQVNRAANYNAMSGKLCDSFLVSVSSGSVMNLTLQIMFVANADVTTTYIPYSNLCPISGWTGLNAWNESTYDQTAQPKLQVSWQSTAGTVYGGSMTVNEDGSGVLTATRELYNMRNHNKTYVSAYDYQGKHGVLINYALVKVATRDAGLCSVATVSTTPANDAPQYMWFGVASAAVFWIGILDALNLTIEEFKTWLGNNDVWICREKSTSVEYSFTNLEQLTTLLGTNNVWVDTGDVTVEYRADTKRYIDKKIAEIVNS